MQRKASDVSPLKSSGNRLGNVCLLCLVLLFSQPVTKFWDRKMPESQRHKCDTVLFLPLTSTRNESDVNSASQCNLP